MSFFKILRPRFARCHGYATKIVANAALSTLEVAKKPGPAGSTTTPESSCPADTILTGLNYLKGQPPVLALPDDQYPEWLWTVLEQKVYPDDGPGGKAERVKRRQENKQRIKERNFMSTQ